MENKTMACRVLGTTPKGYVIARDREIEGIRRTEIGVLSKLEDGKPLGPRHELATLRWKDPSQPEAELEVLYAPKARVGGPSRAYNAGWDRVFGSGEVN